MEDVLQSDRLFQLVRSQATFQQKGLQLQEALQQRTADLALLQAEAKERFGTDDPAQLSAIAERMRLWVQEVIKFDERAHKVVDACLSALKEGIAIPQNTLHELTKLAQIQQGLMDAVSNNSFEVVVSSDKPGESSKLSSTHDPAFDVEPSEKVLSSTAHASGNKAQPVILAHQEQSSADVSASPTGHSVKADTSDAVLQATGGRRNNILGSAQRRLGAAQASNLRPSSESQPKPHQDHNQQKIEVEEPSVNPLLVATGEAVIKDGQIIAKGNDSTVNITGNNSVQDASASVPDQVPEPSGSVVRRPPGGGVRRKL
ncbi:hypothetical protein [Aeromonas hydrophila]|uniref:hypothetical protein n=1 Tax=Aeromonas hydrophila TaxID=644 RepID=UPI002B45DEE4|nr:hypothetical protein [Aeromonas hydrophila]